MNDREKKILTDRLIPVPRKIDFRDGELFLLTEKCPVRITSASEQEKIGEKVPELFRSFWGVTPELRVVRESVPAQEFPGSYAVKIRSDLLEIRAEAFSGVLNAMKTLRQLAEPLRNTAELKGHFLVPCDIEDAPAMEFRGIHLCIFPETPLWDIEKQLRLAAYHKFNYAVIECWGIFPFDSHPEFCWEEKKLDKRELKRLIALGRELGITLVPQFNLLGHAAAARSISGKHAILDFHPELQPLFEPEGWTWCLSNPETRRILADLVTELHEFFGNPPFFHIGCDEADNIGTCLECRRGSLKDLVRDHIRFFRDLFAARNARVIMWHDMLIERGDPRWRGYTACRLPEHDLGDLHKELPKDIIIADWQYGYYKPTEDDPEPTWPTSRFFKEEGFQVVVCPWINPDGTISLGRLAAEEKLFGMLETTWHMNHGRDFARIYCMAAYAAWNPAANPGVTLSTRLAVSHHVRQVGWDMGVTEYVMTGWNLEQVDAGNYPN